MSDRLLFTTAEAAKLLSVTESCRGRPCAARPRSRQGTQVVVTGASGRRTRWTAASRATTGSGGRGRTEPVL